MYVFNRQRNLFPHVLQVCKSFLRCIDVIEIFKFSTPIHWTCLPTALEEWIQHWRRGYTGLNHPSSTRLQTFHGTIPLDSTHTPHGWIQTRTTGYLQHRSHGTNSIDDRRITSDVLHQMYLTVEQQHLDRSTLSQTTNILREDPPDSSSSGDQMTLEESRTSSLTGVIVYTLCELWYMGLRAIEAIQIYFNPWSVFTCVPTTFGHLYECIRPLMSVLSFIRGNFWEIPRIKYTSRKFLGTYSGNKTNFCCLDFSLAVSLV